MSHLNKRCKPPRQQLRLGRVGDVDRIDVTGTEVSPVVGQAIGRKGALVSSHVRAEPAVRTGPYREAREQLRRPAVARDIVQINFRATVAVQRIDCAEQLPTIVDLERLPGIDHRGRRKVCRRSRSCRVGRINRHRPDVRPIRCCRRGVVVGALMSGIVDEPGVLPACAIASALTHQLQVATEPFEGARGSQRSRHLSLQRGLGFVTRAAGGFGHKILSHWRRRRWRGRGPTSPAAAP